MGREAEVGGVCRLLRRDDVRLVTLAGPGGVGKTRLAAAVAERLCPERLDGAWVELASVGEPALVLPALAAACGVAERPGASLADLVAATLRGRRVLVVLDNLEHLLDAVPSLVDVIAGCEPVKVLVTSRATLNVPGEHVVEVPPLSLPSLSDGNVADGLLASGSVELFVARARAADPHFALTDRNAAAVAGLCRRLDGLPLAIELAASWSGVLPPAALLTQLDAGNALLDGGPGVAGSRHRSVRATIAWSHRLLDADGQRLFRRLGVFVGGFDLAAAEHLGRDPTGGSTTLVLGALAGLVRHRMVRPTDEVDDGAPRFAMLETVRESALEQLREAGDEQAARHDHAGHFLALAEDTAPLLYTAEQRRALDRLESELPNIRAALDWFVETSDAERAQRLAGAVFFLWYVRHHLAEGTDVLDRVLACGGRAPTVARAEALRAAGMMAIARGDYPAAERRLDDSLAMARELGDDRAIGLGLFSRALLAEFVGDEDTTIRANREALDIFALLDDRFWRAVVAANLGDALSRTGELDAAAPLCAEALTLARELGDRYVLTRALQPLGNLALARGDWNAAAAAHGEQLTAGTELGDDWMVADALAGLGGVVAGRGDPAGGIRLLAAATRLCDEIGRRKLPGHGQHRRSLLAAEQAVGPVARRAAWDAGYDLDRDQARTLAGRLVAELHEDAPATDPHTLVTPRELEVVRLVADGHSDADVATILGISVRTASSHVGHVLAKLGLANRAAVAAWAVRAGIA